MELYFEPISLEMLKEKVESEGEGELSFPMVGNPVLFDTENLDYESGFMGISEQLIGYHLHPKTGLPFLGVTAGGDWETPVFFIVFWDGKGLRRFVPDDGNTFNPYSMTAIGSEQNSDYEYYDENAAERYKNQVEKEGNEFDTSSLLYSIGKIQPISLRDSGESEQDAIKELESLMGKQLPRFEGYGPDNIFGYRIEEGHVTELRLRNVELRTLPVCLKEFKSLKSLVLDGLPLSQFPEAILSLPSLEILRFSDISDCFKMLPEAIDQLKNLSSLSFQRCFLETVPKNLERVPALWQLFLEDNKLQTLPASLGDIDKLEFLYLSRNEFSKIPEIIFSLSKIRTLDFSNNKLDSISEEIANISSLEELNLESDLLTELPSSLSRLPHLTRLNVAMNKLIEIPPEIGNLKKLYFLDLSNNNLNTLPNTISNFNSLRVLRLKNNGFTSFPENVCEISTLKELDLSGNHITAIPDGIRKMKSLEDLSLDDNPITEIPRCLLELESLKTLRLNGWTQNSDVLEILEKRNVSIRK